MASEQCSVSQVHVWVVQAIWWFIYWFKEIDVSMVMSTVGMMNTTILFGSQHGKILNGNPVQAHCSKQN